MGFALGPGLKNVEKEINLLWEYGSSYDWLYKDSKKDAVRDLIGQAIELETKLRAAKADMERKEADFKRIPAWKTEVEDTKKKLTEAVSARRGLERENSNLERELAELRSKSDDTERATVQQLRKELEKVKQEAELNQQYAAKKIMDQCSTIKSIKEQAELHCQSAKRLGEEVKGLREDIEQVQKNLTQSQGDHAAALQELIDQEAKSKKAKDELQELINDLNAEIRDKDKFANALRADLTISRGLAVKIGAERDAALERLHAIALNATQIKLIVEKDLEIINGHAEVQQEKEPIPTEAYRRESFVD